MGGGSGPKFRKGSHKDRIRIGLLGGGDSNEDNPFRVWGVLRVMIGGRKAGDPINRKDQGVCTPRCERSQRSVAVGW